jgi:DNA-binding MarR family transcriptional regulator
MNEFPARDAAGTLLWQAANAWQLQLRRALAPTGVNFVQYALLAGLAELGRQAGDVTQVRLARHVGTDAMTASQALRGLARRRLITRRVHAADPRARALELAPQGAALVATAAPLVAAAEAQFFAGLGPERAQFAVALGRLLGIRTRVRVAAGQRVPAA